MTFYVQRSMSKIWTLISRLPRKGIIHSTSEGPTVHSNLGWALRGRPPHRSPPSLGTGFPRLVKKLSQLWKGRAVEDALPGEEGGAVKLKCQECGKEWLGPAGDWEQWRWGGVQLHVTDHVRVTTVKDDILGAEKYEQDWNSNLQITKKRCYLLH
jgi:hypothetical protein